MQYPYGSSNNETLWYRQLVKYFFQSTTFFIHASFFVAVILIGIARHGRSVPAEFTVLMTLWSVGFLLHGIMTYRTESPSESERPKSQDGVMKTILLSSAISAIMWVMWTLATDARDSTPWHLSIWLALLVVAILTIIAGKRTLYNHWLKTYSANNSHYEKPKRKRYDTSKLSLELDDDGELPNNFDDTGSENRVNRQ